MAAPATPRRPARATVPEEVAAIDQSYQDQLAKLHGENSSIAERLEDTLKFLNELQAKSRKHEEDIQRLESGLANAVQDLAQKEATITSLRKELQEVHVELKHAGETADRVAKERDAALEAQHAAEDTKDVLEVALQAEQDRAEDLSRELEPLESLRTSLDQCEDEYEEFKEFIVHYLHIETEDFSSEALKGRIRELREPPSHSRNSSHSSHVGKPYGDLVSARNRQASLQQELEKLGNDSDSKKSGEADLDNIPEDDADGEVVVNGQLDTIKEKLAAAEIVQKCLEDDNREKSELLEEARQRLARLDAALNVTDTLAATEAELSAIKIDMAAIKSEQVQQTQENKELKEELDNANATIRQAETDAKAAHETLVAAQAELSTTRTDLAATKSEQVKQAEEKQTLQERIDRANAAIVEIRRGAKNVLDARSAIQQKLSVKESELSTTKFNLNAVKGVQSRQAETVKSFSEQLVKANATIDRAKSDAESVHEKLTATQAELSATQRNLAATQGEQTRQTEENKRLREQLDSANKTVSEGKSAAESAHRELAALKLQLGESESERAQQTEQIREMKERHDERDLADDERNAVGADDDGLLIIKKMLAASQLKQQGQHEKIERLKADLAKAQAANTDLELPGLAKEKIQNLEQELAESDDKVSTLEKQLGLAHEDVAALVAKAKQSPLSATKLTHTATEEIENAKAAATDIESTVLELESATEPAMIVENVRTTSPGTGQQPPKTILLKVPENLKAPGLVTTIKALSWWLIILLVAILVDLYLAFRSDHDSVRYIPSDPVMFSVNGHTASFGIGHGGPTWMDPVYMKLEEWMGIRRSYLS